MREELKASLLDLARLRIEVFKYYPYLYDGSLEYESKYLDIYANSVRCAVIATYHENKMVGAATALPLLDENDYVQKPFIDAQMDLSQIFYFGESVLLKEYRGHGLGHVFFSEREKVALSFNDYKMTCFCAVQRLENHILRPKDYRPLDEFWLKRGYKQTPQLKASFSWKDIGENEETLKPMVYWLKEWT